MVRQPHPVFLGADCGRLLRPVHRYRLGCHENAGAYTWHKIGDKDQEELTEKFSTMPSHPEVPAALRKLRNAGFRLFTLTDNLLEVQTRQLEHGGIVDLFERRFSADGVKHHKPSREAYAYVENELGVEPSQLCLVACHTWDTLGAVAAGWRAALIKRVGNDLLGVGPQPQIVGSDLNDVAN
jgi:2-haloacid dehalogenase